MHMCSGLPRVFLRGGLQHICSAPHKWGPRENCPFCPPLLGACSIFKHVEPVIFCSVPQATLEQYRCNKVCVSAIYAAKQSFLQAGVPEWQTDGILELYKLIDSGSPATNQANLTDFEKITGEKLTNLKVWLSKVGGAFKSPFHLTICIQTHACSLITTSSFVLCLFLEKHVKLLLVMITNYNYSA